VLFIHQQSQHQQYLTQLTITNHPYNPSKMSEKYKPSEHDGLKQDGTPDKRTQQTGMSLANHGTTVLPRFPTGGFVVQ
jgi:hypothetical protein